MTKASFKARYEPDKASAAATVAINAGDFKLRACMTDATVVNGPSLNGLALALEKPGFFIVDYNVPKNDFRFQFMNTVRVAEKPLNLTYIHSKGDERTIVDGCLVIDSANKVSANHVLGTGNSKLKYTYLHGGLTTFEPSYDLGKNAWDFAVSRRVFGDDVFRATYQTSSKNLGLEWSRSSKLHGSFKVTSCHKCLFIECRTVDINPVNLSKISAQPYEEEIGTTRKTALSEVRVLRLKISASVNLAEEQKTPKLCAETTWDFEM